MVKSLKTITIFTLAITALIITGCAKVRVNKVPTPTQYVQWTDKMQHKADKMEGIRFYLPRPFINVFESFPIRTDIYIADGVVSPDHKYVLIRSIKSESKLNEYVVGMPNMTRIPNRYIKKPTADELRDLTDSYGKLAESYAKLEANRQKNADIAAKNVIPTGSISGKSVTSSSTDVGQDQQTTGMNSRKVTNDNMAFAFQPLRGNFDIVYMPDFEEQYVVKSRSGLGNAQFALNLGQGWSLQGFNSLSDNSELNGRIFDLIDSSVQMAKTAASAYFGIPPLPDLQPGDEEFVKPYAGQELGEDDDDEYSIPYSPVSLKIVVVHYAAKGIYPVVKPRELQERVTGKLSASGGFNYVLDLFRSFPRFLGISDYDNKSLQRAQQAVANETGNFTVPRYPYQYISFNTFRYMAIELIKEGDEPFEHLYDKTGTMGDPGDRQTADSSGLIYGGATNDKPPVDKTPDVTTEPSQEELDLIGNSVQNTLEHSGYSIETIKPLMDSEKRLDVNVTINKPIEPEKEENFLSKVKTLVQTELENDSDANISALKDKVNEPILKLSDIAFLKSKKGKILTIVQNEIQTNDDPKIKNLVVKEIDFEKADLVEESEVVITLKDSDKLTEKEKKVIQKIVENEVNTVINESGRSLKTTEGNVEIK